MWLAGVIVVVLIAISVALTIVARRFEPYVRARIVQGLEQRFHTHVELDGFHVQVNNIRKGEWGLWAAGQGLRIWPPHPVNGVQPLDTTVSSGSPLISLNEFSFHVPLMLLIPGSSVTHGPKLPSACTGPSGLGFSTSAT